MEKARGRPAQAAEVEIVPVVVDGGLLGLYPIRVTNGNVIIIAGNVVIIACCLVDARPIVL